MSTLVPSRSADIALPKLRAELLDARAFLRGQLDRRPNATVQWDEGDAPPTSVVGQAAAPRAEVEAQSELIGQLLSVLQWAWSQGYSEVVQCNILAHRRRGAGGGGNHLVAQRRGSRLTVEVSTYNGDTLLRSEIERLLRRLEVPRTNEDRSWPDGRLMVFVGAEVAEAMLSKSRPRRCAYWVVAESSAGSLIEVIPVLDPAQSTGSSPVVPVPFVSDHELLTALRTAGAQIGGTDGDAHVTWPGVVDDAVVAALVEDESQFAEAPPDEWQSAKGWDAYWRRRAIAPDVHRELQPTLEPVFLRYLFRQTRPSIANRTARILCAANGLSLLPHALARAGFDVVVLERSHVATEIGRRQRPTQAQLDPFFSLAAAELDVDDLGAFASAGGTIEWRTGDVMDPAAEPGPFDIVVANRFIEGLSDFDLRVVAGRLVGRLSENGWCWVVVQNSGFKWITAQREFRALGLVVVPYDDLPDDGQAMSGGLMSG